MEQNLENCKLEWDKTRKLLLQLYVEWNKIQKTICQNGTKSRKLLATMGQNLEKGKLVRTINLFYRTMGIKIKPNSQNTVLYNPIKSKLL